MSKVDISRENVMRVHGAAVFADLDHGIPEIRKLLLALRDALDEANTSLELADANFVKVRDQRDILEQKNKDVFNAGGKNAFMDEVLKAVRERVGPHGIDVDNVHAVGQFRMDSRVVDAINRRISAGQETEQRRQQVETARQEAERQRIEAEGQAAANRIVAASVTPELVQYMAAQKWNGQLPCDVQEAAEVSRQGLQPTQRYD